jgi:hypothetical protein
VVVVVGGFVGLQLLPGRVTAASAGVPRPGAVQTAKITRTDLATTLSLEGKLGYGAERAVKGDGDGKVTWLPKSGITLTRGDQVFRVNDQPVLMFYGRTPLFRPLGTIGLVGRDVKVVADNLRDLGYSIGVQPSVGTSIRQHVSADPDIPTTETSAGPTTDPAGKNGSADPKDSVEPTAAAPTYVKVRPGDGVLTASLRAAIKRWQRQIGATPDDVLDPGAVVVLPQSVRVSSVTAQLGDSADSPLISITQTTKVVTVEINASEMESVRGSKKVNVTLPSGDSAPGRVGSISRVVATPDGQDQEPVSSATITLVHPSVIKNLDSAPVQVEFTAQARKNVLTVPVGALLALSEGGYAIQPQGGPLLPVTVGLFAKGLVEISGDGIAEGTAVVTAS